MAEMSIDKHDQLKDHSEDSPGSSGDAEASVAVAPPESQPPKRKGGRKPIYATSEERKQRNRQAQAAFRERRTEHIKHLEEALRAHEQNLANLQTAHRNAAEECLMLRYKNSLLERILLEKGIDVQAELQAKTGSPNLGPTHMAPSLVQPPPIQRAILNRHHARRSTAGSTMAPKLEPGIGAASSILPPPSLSTASTPKSRPTPSASSHATSPTTTTSYGASPNPTGPADQHLAGTPAPMRMQQTIMKPAHPQQMSHVGMVPAMAQQQMQQPQHQHQQVMVGMHQGSEEIGHARGGSIGGGSVPYFQTHSFPSHIEMEQEFHAAGGTNMIDNPTAEAPASGPGPPGETQLTSPITSGPPPGHHLFTPSLPPHHPSHQHMQSQELGGGGGGRAAGPRGVVEMHPGYPGSMNQMLESDYDFDPFGLSASMAFPSQFSFDTSNMR